MNIIKQYVDRLLQYIDSGRFFRNPLKVLYILFGVCAFLPAVMLLLEFFSEDTWNSLNSLGYYLDGWSKVIMYLALFLILVYLVLLGIIGLYYWLNRKNDLYNTIRIGDKIKALPTIAHFVKCLGESYGVLSFLAPLGVYIISYVLLLITGFKPLGVVEIGEFFKYLFLGLLVAPVLAVILFLHSYLIILLAHGISERLFIKTSIANNVSDIGDIQRATTMTEEESEELHADQPHVETEQPVTPIPTVEEMTEEHVDPTKEL